MTTETQAHDLAQMIAQAIMRTDDPKASQELDPVTKHHQVIGVVPLHLQHLFHLMSDLGDEAKAAAQLAEFAKRRLSIVHSIFYESLKTHVPEPADAAGVHILEGWNVAVLKESDSAGEALAQLIGSMLGRRR